MWVGGRVGEALGLQRAQGAEHTPGGLGPWEQGKRWNADRCSQHAPLKVHSALAAFAPRPMQLQPCLAPATSCVEEACVHWVGWYHIPPAAAHVEMLLPAARIDVLLYCHIGQRHSPVPVPHPLPLLHACPPPSPPPHRGLSLSTSAACLSPPHTHRGLSLSTISTTAACLAPPSPPGLFLLLYRPLLSLSRVRGDAYYQLFDELLSAVRRRYGNTTLLQFEDLAYDNASKLLNMYRSDFPCFNDELQVGWVFEGEERRVVVYNSTGTSSDSNGAISSSNHKQSIPAQYGLNFSSVWLWCVIISLQGMGTAVLAAILGSLPKTGGSLADHTVLLSGEGPASSCVAELLAAAISLQTGEGGGGKGFGE